MSIYSRIRWAAGVLAACLLSGCAQEEPALPLADEAPASTVGSGQAKAPFDVQKVMDQVHFAFRPKDSAWEGGHSTYAVRVAADGFSVTPYHYPQGQPEGAEAPRPSPEQRLRRAESPSQEYVEGDPVRFGAAQVSRGVMALSSLKAQGQVKDSGGLMLARSDVAEHFRNSKDGMEQSWNFEQMPGGTGDLEVRLPVESGRFLGETAQGLHFAAGTTGLGVRYGHGTWVDAEGHRTPVPAHFEAGAIVLSVPAQVVDASAYPAVLDPIVSPESGMDDPVYGPADNSQYSPAVAHNGTNFLVVWEDQRSGYTDIYGARVSSAGTVLDIAGIRISAAISHQFAPQVAQDGTNFLVVWQDYRVGNSRIYGARVSDAGTVLDPGGIPISTATNSQYNPAVAHDGTNFLVVWDDTRSGTSYDIYGTRVSGAGTVLDISGIPISTAANDQRIPAVAHNGTNFLVVWQDSRSDTGFSDIYGARVNGAGTVLNTSGIRISNAVNSQGVPAVAFNGTDFLVVWQDYRSGTNYDIYGARVSSTGVVRNPSGIPISTATNHQANPSVAREGTNCLVVWHDSRSYDIYGARVNNSGTVLDTSSILISTAGSTTYSPSVAHDGSNFLVVWQDYKGINSPNIYGVRVSGSGTVLGTSDTSISMSANGQYTPAVAHDGTNFLVVWEDHRSGNSDIYGVLVSDNGEVLDASGISISTNTSYQYTPAVVYGVTDFLIVWQDYRNGSADIYGTRVSSTGTVLDTGGIPISTSTSYENSPAVSYNGVDFLVVWEDSRSGTNYDIYGARVSSTGTVLNPSGISISTATGDQYNPVIAQDGANFLVVWEDSRSGTNYDIYGTRVSSTGTVLDASGISISTSANNQSSPAVVHNGTHYLVVWQDSRSGSSDIYGARVSGAGTVQETSGISISTATNSQQAPSVAYDGTSFLVVWQDFRGGTGFSDIYGAQVKEDGMVVYTSGFVISAEPVAEVEPRLTSMEGGNSLVVYRSSHDSAETNSERVRARVIQPSAP